MTKKQQEAKKLIAPALEASHAALMNSGAAQLTRYGEQTRAVRALARKQLENTARAYFLAVMAAEEVLK